MNRRTLSQRIYRETALAERYGEFTEVQLIQRHDRWREVEDTTPNLNHLERARVNFVIHALLVHIEHRLGPAWKEKLEDERFAEFDAIQARYEAEQAIPSFSTSEDAA